MQSIWFCFFAHQSSFPMRGNPVHWELICGGPRLPREWSRLWMTQRKCMSRGRRREASLSNFSAAKEARPQGNPKLHPAPSAYSALTIEGINEFACCKPVLHWLKVSSTAQQSDLPVWAAVIGQAGLQWECRFLEALFAAFLLSLILQPALSGKSCLYAAAAILLAFTTWGILSMKFSVWWIESSELDWQDLAWSISSRCCIRCL